MSLRSRIEHASAPLAERLNALPRTAGLAVLAAVLLVGILAPAPWAGMAFLLVAALLGWLLFLTWQRLVMPERLLRFAVLALVLAVGIVRLVP